MTRLNWPRVLWCGAFVAMIAEFAPAIEPSPAPPPGFSGHVSFRSGSDKSRWTIRFETSGSMPDSKTGYFWDVPDTIDQIEIAEDVTFHGGLRVGYRPTNRPLRIQGDDRKTSRIHGTDQSEWTQRRGIAEHDKWTYSGISVLADAVVQVDHLTVENPCGYLIAGYANESVLHVSRCDLIDTRPGDNNNSDGFAGSAGSSIRDCFISTGDDAIKIYHDMTIDNVTIEQRRNGAAIQLGWGDENDAAVAMINNLTIRGVSEDGLYNLAPITWIAGQHGSRDLRVTNLHVDMQGKRYNELNQTWIPLGLLDVRPEGCHFNLTINDLQTSLTSKGTVKSPGTIRIENQVISSDQSDLSRLKDSTH